MGAGAASERPGPPVRVAGREDIDAVTDVICSAFREDPLWTWAFPDHSGIAPWWRLLIASATRYPWVSVAGDFMAVSVWIPPNGRELTEQEEGELAPLAEELAGSRSPEVMELMERFDASHPKHTPHFYLSLVGTHPEHRGKGVGVGLLADNLSKIDELGMPAYLESSNPANQPRYERLGFEQIGEFSTPDDSRTVTTMWREPRSP